MTDDQKQIILIMCEKWDNTLLKETERFVNLVAFVSEVPKEEVINFLSERASKEVVARMGLN